jgi:hypothetical protein
MRKDMARELFHAIILAGLVALAAAAAEASCRGDEGMEILRIRVVNDYQGAVAVSRDMGLEWEQVGRVLRYTESVNERGYTASKWVEPGHVAATAVNAIHLNVGENEMDDRGIVFSLLPREFLAPPKDYRSFLSPDSSIYTDIRAGTAIFGGDAAPLVGSPVFLEIDSVLVPVMADYVPRRGDVLLIRVLQSVPGPISVEFENWSGGSVIMLHADGSKDVLGWVIRPVRGVGRFAGSIYASVGRIRAGHAGVVDVSTSPDGLVGAFQIIPVGHALSPEMQSAWQKTQWMIVGPVENESDLWEGLRPLFCGYVRPVYRADDLTLPRWRQRVLAHFLVDVESGDGWGPMPCLRLGPNPSAPLPEWANYALEGVDRVRILFPLPGD